MIGMAMRLMTGGLIGGGGTDLLVVLGPLIAICAICGVYQCSKFRIRDVGCIKRCLRATGVDEYDDFEVMIVVHDVKCTFKNKVDTVVRITAGSNVCETDSSNKQVFQQPFSLWVEQGTQDVVVDLLDRKTVLATYKMNVMKDILKDAKENPDKFREKTFVMAQKAKGCVSPKVKLTVAFDDLIDEAEKGVLSGLEVSAETQFMLRQQLNKAQKEQSDKAPSTTMPSKTGSKDELEKTAEGQKKNAPSGEVGLLSTGCQGPLIQFSSWGSKSNVYAAIQGPPDTKKYQMAIWNSERSFEKGEKPATQVDMLRVESVQGDPKRNEIFTVVYYDKDKVKQTVMFQRVDRPRDVWVEMFLLLIRKVRQEREEKGKSGDKEKKKKKDGK